VSSNWDGRTASSFHTTSGEKPPIGPRVSPDTVYWDGKYRTSHQEARDETIRHHPAGDRDGIAARQRATIHDSGDERGTAGSTDERWRPPREKDRIGLTATQRQMIAWSIAGLAEMQPVPSRFQPTLGTKAPKDLSLSQVPGIVQGVAPPAANYEYAMLADKDLLLVTPQDGTIADVIHLNRRL
jgi:hypothetical protein